jgi:dTDP-4-dehydrorhamnose 3,5-epimerase-like enzyme
MATTLEQIASFLDNRGWFYEVDKEARKRRGMYPS